MPQYEIPKIDAKNIVNKIFIGPSSIPKIMISCKSPKPIGCFLTISHVNTNTIDKYPRPTMPPYIWYIICSDDNQTIKGMFMIIIDNISDNGII